MIDYSEVINFMINQHYLFESSVVIDKDFFIDKENKKLMAHNYCISLPSNREDEAVNHGKFYTQPHQEIDPTNKFEFTPLRNSNIHNKMNKTAKIVKIKCGPKIQQEMQKIMNLSSIHAEIKTQISQKKIDKTFEKGQQIDRFSKLKKNNLKPVIYKSDLLIHQHSYSNSKLDISCTELMPKSRKTSISLSRQRKNTQQNLTSKQEGNNSSKSKKKIQFTVYQSRKKSQSKNSLAEESPKKDKTSQLKHIESVYSLPYPCNTNIVIDLFHRKICNKLNTSSAKSRDKSVSRQKSKEKSKNYLLHKFLQKDSFTCKNQLIQSTLLKLKKFQIVNDYANQMEIENLLKSFVLAGQPECKWVLLVIDEIFKKIRSPQNDKF